MLFFTLINVLWLGLAVNVRIFMQRFGPHLAPDAATPAAAEPGSGSPAKTAPGADASEAQIASGPQSPGATRPGKAVAASDTFANVACGHYHCRYVGPLWQEIPGSGDLGTQEVPSLQGCADLCDRVPDCASFEFPADRFEAHDQRAAGDALRAPGGQQEGVMMSSGGGSAPAAGAQQQGAAEEEQPALFDCNLNSALGQKLDTGAYSPESRLFMRRERAEPTRLFMKRERRGAGDGGGSAAAAGTGLIVERGRGGGAFAGAGATADTRVFLSRLGTLPDAWEAEAVASGRGVRNSDGELEFDAGESLFVRGTSFSAAAPGAAGGRGGGEAGGLFVAAGAAEGGAAAEEEGGEAGARAALRTSVAGTNTQAHANRVSGMFPLTLHFWLNRELPRIPMLQMDPLDFVEKPDSLIKLEAKWFSKFLKKSEVPTRANSHKHEQLPVVSPRDGPERLFTQRVCQEFTRNLEQDNLSAIENDPCKRTPHEPKLGAEISNALAFSNFVLNHQVVDPSLPLWLEFGVFQGRTLNQIGGFGEMYRELGSRAAGGAEAGGSGGREEGEKKAERHPFTAELAQKIVRSADSKFANDQHYPQIFGFDSFRGLPEDWAIGVAGKDDPTGRMIQEVKSHYFASHEKFRTVLLRHLKFPYEISRVKLHLVDFSSPNA